MTKPKKLPLDSVTRAFLKLNPGIRITVAQCTKCGLWYDPSLKHECKKKGK